MKKVLLSAIVAMLFLIGCATNSQQSPSERVKAMEIVDYGFSHALGRSGYDKMWERIQFGENAKYLNAPANGVAYCFDCDAKRRGVPEQMLKEWHQVVADQLESSDPFVNNQPDPSGLHPYDYVKITHNFYELGDGGGERLWIGFRERVIKVLTARADFRKYFYVADAPLCALGPYPNFTPGEVDKNMYIPVRYTGQVPYTGPACAEDSTKLIDMALTNVLVHARRCMTSYDSCS